MINLTQVTTLVTALSAILAAVTAVVGVLKTNAVHLSLNSRLDEWKSETAEKILSSYARGREDERNTKKKLDQKK
jgi:phage-related minor tail protein